MTKHGLLECSIWYLFTETPIYKLCSITMSFDCLLSCSIFSAIEQNVASLLSFFSFESSFILLLLTDVNLYLRMTRQGQADFWIIFWSETWVVIYGFYAFGINFVYLKRRIDKIYILAGLIAWRMEDPLDELIEGFLWSCMTKQSTLGVKMVFCYFWQSPCGSNCTHGVFLELQAFVTEEDGMESIAHRFLSAAVKVGFTSVIFFVFCY